MARKARVEFEGAVFHVLDRGDRREAIFKDDLDRRRFVETLGEVCGRTGWRVHAFVLMSNHYHLMIETPEANLVAGMRWFQTTLTVRYNRRHRLSGHLFQGRYNAVVVDAEERRYFPVLSDYIHLSRHKGTGPLSTFVTHGQLKEVARHFFDRLQAELYYPTSQSYPWDAPIAQPVADYAVANLGQIKSLFQFDLATDSDQDGIPDWWEKPTASIIKTAMMLFLRPQEAG